MLHRTLAQVLDSSLILACSVWSTFQDFLVLLKIIEYPTKSSANSKGLFNSGGQNSFACSSAWALWMLSVGLDPPVAPAQIAAGMTPNPTKKMIYFR